MRSKDYCSTLKTFCSNLTTLLLKSDHFIAQIWHIFVLNWTVFIQVWTTFVKIYLLFVHFCTWSSEQFSLRFIHQLWFFAIFRILLDVKNWLLFRWWSRTQQPENSNHFTFETHPRISLIWIFRSGFLPRSGSKRSQKMVLLW